MPEHLFDNKPKLLIGSGGSSAQEIGQPNDSGGGGGRERELTLYPGRSERKVQPE